MTYNEIISLAMQTGGTSPLTCTIQLEDDAVVRFAELVATAEREACAKACDFEAENWDSDSEASFALIDAAAGIRKRGANDGCGCCGDHCASRGGDCRFSEENPQPGIYGYQAWYATHLKTGDEYRVIGEAIDATNTLDSQPVVIYRGNGQTFVREKQEFNEKFSPYSYADKLLSEYKGGA